MLWFLLKTDVWVKQRMRYYSLCVVPAVSGCGWHFLSARWTYWGFSSLRFWMDTDFQNCLNVLDLFRKAPAQHKLPTSNCVSQWPITSITGHLHNAFPIMHAGVIIACTTAVSECRCSSVPVLTCAWTAQTSGWEQHSQGCSKARHFGLCFVLGRSSPLDLSLELHVISRRNEAALQWQRLLWLTLPVSDSMEADGNIWMVFCREFYNRELQWHPAVFLKQVSPFTRYSISLLSWIINWEAFPCGWCIFPQMICRVNVSWGGLLISVHHFARNPPKLLRNPKLLKDNRGVSLRAHHLYLLQE